MCQLYEIAWEFSTRFISIYFPMGGLHIIFCDSTSKLCPCEKSQNTKWSPWRRRNIPPEKKIFILYSWKTPRRKESSLNEKMENVRELLPSFFSHCVITILVAFFCYATAAYGENIVADLSLDALPRSLTIYIPPHMKKFCNFKPNYHLSSISMATLQQQINCRLLSNFVWFIIGFGFAFLVRWYQRWSSH